MFYDIPPVGVGFNADQLHEASLRALWIKLRDESPALLQLARDTMLAHLKSERAMGALRIELNKALGTENLKLALDALNRDAVNELRTQDAAREQQRERDAVEAARTKAETKPTAPSVSPPAAQKPVPTQNARR